MSRSNDQVCHRWHQIHCNGGGFTARPSDHRRGENAHDAMVRWWDDVPTPEEIGPSLLDRFDCDETERLRYDNDIMADDDQPYCDAP